MKKISLLILIQVLLLPVLSAQTVRPRIIAGTETGGTVIHYAQRTGISPSVDWALRFNPYVMVRIGRHFFPGIGVSREAGRFRGMPLGPLNGVGLHARYYVPLAIKDDWIMDRFRFFGEGAWYLLDHSVSDQTGIQVLDGFSNHEIRLLAGVNFRAFSGLYLTMTYHTRFYSQGKPFLFNPSVALEYHFGEKRAPFTPAAPPPAPDRKPFKVYDPEGFLKKVVLGASYTFIFDDQNTGDLFYYKEHTVNLNAAVALGADLDLGIAWLSIGAREGTNPSQRYTLAGAFLQYNFLRNHPSIRAFAETGFYRGNYCTCGDEAPYFKPNLSYIPFGGGLESRLFKSPHWYLDLSFLWYQLVSRVPDEYPYAFSQYIFGLNYHFSP
ncbi:MAG: hypothetical protein IPL49_01005 [Saprospirales bacterium]|nr:hypothetical protein [Saprospirales bacterium]MBK8489497.1 hypothetical protein [Saprospirales bacterium]